MCDFPNVENNDLELEMLGEFCGKWERRIALLGRLFGEGYADESLILCGCYIEAIGGWLYKPELSGREIFARALTSYGRNDIFGALNPILLLRSLQGYPLPAGDADKLQTVLVKLGPAFLDWRDGFYPHAEVRARCRQVLTVEECDLLDKFLWMGTLACAMYGITRCEDLREVMFRFRHLEGATPDFHLFYSALGSVFESARRLIMSGKLRIW